MRDQTRYGLLAASWEAGGKAENRLLLGSDVAAAKDWLERRPRTMPEPSEAVRDFIRASEEAETRRTSEERRRLAEIAAAQEEREKALHVLRALAAHPGDYSDHAGGGGRRARLGDLAVT